LLVGDEVFPLPEHVLRPYRNKQLTCLKRARARVCIYSYSLSRVRRIVDFLKCRVPVANAPGCTAVYCTTRNLRRSNLHYQVSCTSQWRQRS
jgi:hypothetical protein